MTFLDRLYTLSGTDKGSNCHNYANTYDELFSPFRDKEIKFLEIGVEYGISAKVWLDYFSVAKIYGVDIEHKHSVKHSRFTFSEGDQRDFSFWNDFLIQYGSGWDVIVDDGCHHTSGIMVSLYSLWPHVKPGGYYIVEDLMCSYLPSCNERNLPTQVEFLKTLIDDLNSQTKYSNTSEARAFPPGTDDSRSIEWIRFSEELCILKKK